MFFFTTECVIKVSTRTGQDCWSFQLYKLSSVSKSPVVNGTNVKQFKISNHKTCGKGF